MTQMPSKAPIFLSAGVPYPDPVRNPDGQKYPCDAIAVREAIRALVGVVVPDRPLVFGGQPAITPFIWDAASSLNAQELVYIFQSDLYRGQTPHQVRFFRNVVWTPAFPGADPKNAQHRQQCLLTMRQQMIETRFLEPPVSGSQPRVLPAYDAAFFIGGMDGVEDEWKMFTSAYPTTPVFPIGSTEGAARQLLQNWPPPNVRWRGPIPQRHDLENGLRYRALFRQLLQ